MTFLRRLHEDEEGMETLQTVMVVAVAAIILALVQAWWPRIKTWFRASVREVVNWRE